ncbi:MAG TPA: hypothetical protein VL588_02295, partial [Bdellovibrionota bacterium]|nr:hypothetical protein [Bdellovibrionota bacterium]
MSRASLLAIVLALAGCAPQAEDFPPSDASLFTADPPADPAYREEVEYMRRVSGFSQERAARVIEKVRAASQALSLPPAVLWCVLFQESRLDHLKNAFNTQNAKGIGQFTSAALGEINTDTDLYDPRTTDYLTQQVGAHPLPLGFTLKDGRGAEPEAPRSSYYRLETGVASTAVYLNNRYQHLVRTLVKRELKYDPQVIWLLAAAAYNKGPRSMNVFLYRAHEFKGARWVHHILHDPLALVAGLSDRRMLNRVYFYFWEKS